MNRKEDLPKIKLFAELNRLAYNPKEVAKPEFEKLGYSVLEYINISGIQGYVLLNTYELIFVFRGTDERDDILVDTNAFMSKHHDYRIHTGFSRKAHRVNALIKSYLNTCTENRLVYFTGHSYGGALALVVASQTYCTQVVTFGCPRVGDRDFSLHYKDVRHLRVRNNMDIVTKIPFWTLGYRHHGELVYLDYFGNIVEKPDLWKLFKDTVRSRVKAWGKKQWWDGFYDHSMKEYIDKLNRY